MALDGTAAGAEVETPPHVGDGHRLLSRTHLEIDAPVGNLDPQVIRRAGLLFVAKSPAAPGIPIFSRKSSRFHSPRGLRTTFSVIPSSPEAGQIQAGPPQASGQRRSQTIRSTWAKGPPQKPGLSTTKFFITKPGRGRRRKESNQR